VEYYICSMDEASKIARLPLRAPEILAKLDAMQETNPSSKEIIWHPEYANWMLEATPGQPYGESIEGLMDVGANMILQRKHISAVLQPGEHLFSMTCFPRMGTPGFTSPALPLRTTADGVAQSMYIPDEAINPHPRFPTLTANIRKRRGEKVSIAVPIYKDRFTDAALQQQADHAASLGVELPASLPPDSIYMDSMIIKFNQRNSLHQTLSRQDTPHRD
jgi:glutamate--cysteine ligase catalytic subunit